MDFIKTQRKNSTSSNDSQKPGGTTSSHGNNEFDLEYFTTTSTTSSSSSCSSHNAEVSKSKSKSKSTARRVDNLSHHQKRTMVSSSQTVDNMLYMEAAVQPSTSRQCGSTSTRYASSSPISPVLSISPLVLPSSTSSHSSCSPLPGIGHEETVSCDRHGKKRKRSFNDQEPDLGYQPPSPKRQQSLHTVYISPKSVTDYLHNKLEQHSSSEYDESDDLPDSPNSCLTKASSCVDDFAHADELTNDELISNAADETLKAVKLDPCYANEHYAACLTPAAEPEPLRQCPLPALSWANAEDVWNLMCKKDAQAASLRHSSMLDRHPTLQARMRAILLDWLIEVCEVYKLHRETYYLAVDYLDRYLSAQKNVQKTHLQLIGITCLFIAAKVEEIYPPKIGEFAYVTDGACQEQDILQTEILLLQALEWQISPLTTMGWLGVYMQLNVNNRTPASFSTTATEERRRRRRLSASAETEVQDTDDAFIYPQFSGLEFAHTAQLLDLCTMDVAFGQYPYSVIAASAMSHTFSRETAMRCSGYEWSTLKDCASWMEPFFNVVRDESKFFYLSEQSEQVHTKFGLGHICPNIVTDDTHIIQTHTTTMDMFDRVCLNQAELHATLKKLKQEASPAIGLIYPEGLLTPPSSSRKPPEEDEEQEYEEQSTNINGNSKEYPLHQQQQQQLKEQKTSQRGFK